METAIAYFGVSEFLHHGHAAGVLKLRATFSRRHCRPPALASWIILKDLKEGPKTD